MQEHQQEGGSGEERGGLVTRERHVFKAPAPKNSTLGASRMGCRTRCAVLLLLLLLVVVVSAGCGFAGQHTSGRGTRRDMHTPHTAPHTCVPACVVHAAGLDALARQKRAERGEPEGVCVWARACWRVWACVCDGVAAAACVLRHTLTCS
jgi:hypothetical protein